MNRIICTIFLTVLFAGALFSQEAVTVKIETAELRGTPNADGIVVATLNKDDTGEVIASRGPWRLIQTQKHVGWVIVDAIVITGNSSGKSSGWGDPNGRFSGISDGQGTGDGQGVGSGTGQGGGMGTGHGTGKIGGKVPPQADKNITPIKFLSKPRPAYTETARKNKVNGSVVLRIVFLANGTIGPIRVVSGLPDGLNEQAIKAARGITFEPMLVNGIATATTKSVTMSFSVY